MYDKKLSKGDRNAIKSARRITKQTGARDSEKYLRALNGQHVSVTHTVKKRSLIDA